MLNKKTWLAWLGISFILSNTFDGLWSNGVGQNRETDKENDDDCVDEEFQLARVKYDRIGAEGREALVVRNCSINVWHESELN